MSVLFGPIVQQGYVVPDLEKALRHWIARGVGPFFVEELRDYPGVYRGHAQTFDLNAAFSYSGDQQIEVIQPVGDAPSIYRDWLEKHPEGGLQHVAVWVDDIDAKRSELEASGHRYEVIQSYGDRHAYLDSATEPGVMVQLMARTENNTRLFQLIGEAAAVWDGSTAPVRRIDWSTGRPVIADEDGADRDEKRGGRS